MISTFASRRPAVWKGNPGTCKERIARIGNYRGVGGGGGGTYLKSRVGEHLSSGISSHETVEHVR